MTGMTGLMIGGVVLQSVFRLTDGADGRAVTGAGAILAPVPGWPALPSGAISHAVT
jgi:hypothetical protein